MTIAPPSRQLDEFEELVYMYATRTGRDDTEEVPTYLPMQRWDFDPEGCNLRFESATRGPPAKASFLFTVSPKQCNFLGNIHGGCAATIIDVLSTMILLGVSTPGVFQLGGVSRHLNVTYLRPVPVHTEARLVCEVVQVGRRLALLKAEIYRVDNGDLCVVGQHEKANTDPGAGGKV